jgi:hypothetical protein
MNVRSSTAACLLLLLCAGRPGAQASAAETHVVSRIVFHVTGMTTEGALRTFLSMNPPLREGVAVASAADLAALLDRKKADLVNDRVFKDVQIADEPGQAVDGRVEHVVIITVVDAFSFFPLPYPSYDSNSGFQLGVETHYDNGLGTMTNWYLDMYLVLRTYDEVYGVGAWKIHPKISNLVLFGTPCTLDCTFEHQENSTVQDGELVADYTDYIVTADLNTTFGFASNWYYRPELNGHWTFDYVDRLPGGSAYNRDPLGLTLTNTVGVGRVDWVGNFRKGWDLNAAAAASILDRNDQLSATGIVNVTTAWYVPWKLLNYYGRAHLQYAINDEPTGLGSWLRGVADNSMSGVAGAFTNQTLAIDAIPWKGWRQWPGSGS